LDDQKLNDVNVSQRLLDIAIEINHLRDYSLTKSEERIDSAVTIGHEMHQQEEREVGYRKGLGEAYRVVMQAHNMRLGEVERVAVNTDLLDSRLCDHLRYRPGTQSTED
jgi:hypothetical protein